MGAAAHGAPQRRRRTVPDRERRKHRLPQERVHPEATDSPVVGTPPPPRAPPPPTAVSPPRWHGSELLKRRNHPAERHVGEEPVDPHPQARIAPPLPVPIGVIRRRTERRLVPPCGECNVDVRGPDAQNPSLGGDDTPGGEEGRRPQEVAGPPWLERQHDQVVTQKAVVWGHGRRRPPAPATSPSPG